MYIIYYATSMHIANIYNIMYDICLICVYLYVKCIHFYYRVSYKNIIFSIIRYNVSLTKNTKTGQQALVYNRHF